MQVCKLKLKNDQNIEAIMFPNMKLQLQPQNIPNHWQDLEGEWANQDTCGVTAQILLGPDQATCFPHAVKDSTGALLQVDQARLMKSEITGKYIIFRSSSQSRPTENEILGIGNNQVYDPKISNTLEPWGFKCPKFGYKDSPTLVAEVTRNIESFHYQEGTHKLKPLIVKQTKESLEKAFNDDLNVKGLSILGESKEEDTTSKSFSIRKFSCSSNPGFHQTRKDEL